MFDGNGVTVASCGGKLPVTPFEATEGPQATPPPDPLHSLAIQLQVPSSVAAGAVLRYTVTLRNPSVDGIAFPVDCPIYGEWVPNFAKEFYVLNCAPVRAIQPGQSVTFGMELAVPPTTSSGAYTLYWDFVSGSDPALPGKVAITITH